RSPSPSPSPATDPCPPGQRTPVATGVPLSRWVGSVGGVGGAGGARSVLALRDLVLDLGQLRPPLRALHVVLRLPDQPLPLRARCERSRGGEEALLAHWSLLSSGRSS